MFKHVVKKLESLIARCLLALIANYSVAVLAAQAFLACSLRPIELEEKKKSSMDETKTRSGDAAFESNSITLPPSGS
jgi:hypothetical protein